ncbi:hypothetical protein [Streptomyces tendae]|uniref:hypothetical protein n=1 Tax=Streptomyces tendae TaxID=1932 RepID=UPI002492DEE2|nr:hypothetical protein [Streptomyces tendae]
MNSIISETAAIGIARGPATAPTELLDRHLHHLPAPTAQNIRHQPEHRSQNNVTKSY